MPKVEVAKHLHKFFPVLKDRELTVEGATAFEVVMAMNGIAPGFSDYILTERGTLRQHVNVFIGDEMIVDRQRLSDRVPEGATVSILQALSGG